MAVIAVRGRRNAGSGEAIDDYRLQITDCRMWIRARRGVGRAGRQPVPDSRLLHCPPIVGAAS